MDNQKNKAYNSNGTITTDDGVEIFWQTKGEGPMMICCNGVGVSTFFWKYINIDFHKTNTILTWDYRGHGESQRNLHPKETDLSIARHAKDLKQVLDHLRPEEEQVILIGHSMGCQVALEFQHLFPQRIQGLMLLLGTAGRALETFGDNPMSPYIFRAIRRLNHKIGPKINTLIHPLIRSPVAWPFTTRFELVDPLYTSHEDFQPYLDHLASMDILLFTEAIWACQQHDAWPYLKEIDIPVLVVAAERDTFTPVHCAQDMVKAIPTCEFMVLADGSHAALIEQPENISHRFKRFIRDHQLLEPQQLQHHN